MRLSAGWRVVGRFGAVVAMTQMFGVVACGDDKAAPGADSEDVAGETSDDIVEVPDMTADSDDVAVEVADDVGDVGDEDVADVAEPGDTTTPPEPGEFVLGTAGLADEYVFKGVWAGMADRIVAVGNDGVVATQAADGTWSVLANAEGTALFNSVHGASRNQLWAVGSNSTIVRGSADSFGATSACEFDEDCADGDSCTINSCVNNICQAESTLAAGCCGTTPGSWNFDNGILEPWTVSLADRIGPWDWRVVSVPGRSASGSHALYFGNHEATPPTYDAPGQHVRGVIASPIFRVPPSGTAALHFKIYLDAEPDPEYDYVAIEVDAGGVRSEVWHKRDLEFVPTAGFVDAVADLRPWLGQQISLRIRFDSIDDSVNSFEGPYLDDLRVETTCTGSGAVATTRGPALWGVHALRTDFAAAVGQNGTILQWDGIAWSQPGGADRSANWNAMSGLGSTLALVGSDGAAGLARSGSFVPVTTGTTFHLNGVHIPDAGQYVAVGDSGVIVMGTSAVWSRVQSGTTTNLRDVHGVAGDLWAVGTGGTLLHFNGSAWSAVASGTTNNLIGVWRFSEDRVMAVGRDGIVIEGNATDGFVETARLASGLDLLDLWAMPDGSMVVAVGQNGRIFVARDGGAFVQSESPTSQNLDTVWGSGPEDLWVVGRAGTVLRWDGTAWVRVQSPIAAPLTGVWGDAPDRFYAAGAAGSLMVWDGESWTSATGGTTEHLRAVHLRTSNDGWAVGAKGAVLRYRGLGWASLPVMIDAETPFEEELHAVWGFSSTDAWAVGSNGAVIRWNGEVWEIQQMPWTITLRGLYALAPNDMWAVGNQGHILHWNGEDWSKIETGSIATLHAIHGDGRKHVVAVGSIGTVLKLQRD